MTKTEPVYMSNMPDNAEDLFQMLKDARERGIDLKIVYVQNGAGDNFGLATMHRNTLTDGSITFDLRFC